MLFIPTTGGPGPIGHINRGQIYNLDLDERLGFQFNPEGHAFEKESRWVRRESLGSRNGGDVQYLNDGPIEFDLSLVYVAEPTAPAIETSNIREQVRRGDDDPFDFAELNKLFLRWLAPIEGKQRPGRLMVIVGDLVFYGVISRYSPRVVESFESGAAREVVVKLTFHEWRRNVA